MTEWTGKKCTMCRLLSTYSIFPCVCHHRHRTAFVPSLLCRLFECEFKSQSNCCQSQTNELCSPVLAASHYYYLRAEGISFSQKLLFAPIRRVPFVAVVVFTQHISRKYLIVFAPITHISPLETKQRREKKKSGEREMGKWEIRLMRMWFNTNPMCVCMFCHIVYRRYRLTAHCDCWSHAKSAI